MKVFKYMLDSDEQLNIVLMPKNANILSAKLQNLEICVWAEVNPESPPIEKRRFWLIGTGEPMPEFNPYSPVTLKFIDTVVTPAFVWHVYVEDITL